MSTIDHSALNQLAQKRKWWFCPSEGHGILSALCGFGASDKWAQLLVLDPQVAPEKELFPRLIEHIDQTLQNNDLDFSLLLPPETSLPERAQALVSWASGFCLVARYLREEQCLPALDPSSEEFLNDIAEISKLDALLFDNEENRRMLSTLEEHGRMGTLLLYADVHQHQPR